jgi:hypothetical protein
MSINAPERASSIATDGFPAFMRTAVRPPFTPIFSPASFPVLNRFSLDNRKFCRVRCTVTKFVELSALSASWPYVLLCVGIGAGVFRLFFLRTLFPACAHPAFLRVDSKTEISAFDTESCVKLIGAVTGTASHDGVRFENLMLARDVTGQTRPSPIPRCGDGNKSEEKECKLL